MLFSSNPPAPMKQQIKHSVKRLNANERWMIFDGKPIGDAGIDYLFKQLDERSANLAKSLSLSQSELTDACIPALIKVVGFCQNLEELNISRNQFSPAGLEQLFTALEKHPSLAKISVGLAPVGAEAGAALAKLITNPPRRLQEIKAEGMALGDAGLSAVSNALLDDTQVFTLVLNDNGGTKESARDLAKVIRNNLHITTANLTQDDREADYLLRQAFAESNSLNLVYAYPSDEKVEAVSKRNQHAVRQAANYLRQEPETLTYIQRALVEERYTGAQYHYVFGSTRVPLEQALARYEAVIAKMPALPAVDEHFAEAIFTENAQGFTPLDNPRNWQNPEILFSGLAASNIPLSKDYLARRTAQGVGFLESAAATAPAGRLVEALNARGLQLGKKELLDAEGTPTPLLNTFIERGEAQALFSVGNWVGKSPKELTQVYKALPEHQREGIAINTLRQDISPRHGLGRYERPESSIAL